MTQACHAVRGSRSHRTRPPRAGLSARLNVPEGAYYHPPTGTFTARAEPRAAASAGARSLAGQGQALYLAG
jgi:hypothetical protein